MAHEFSRKSLYDLVWSEPRVQLANRLGVSDVAIGKYCRAADIELVHYSWFDDYSKAERDLHRLFQNKRMEGEWFDLGDTDLENIRTFGDRPN